MADFCSRCYKEMGFEAPDIDLIEESKVLEPDHFIGPFLCEGCGNIFILCDENGIIRVDDGSMIDSTKPEEFPTIEEFINSQMPPIK